MNKNKFRYVIFMFYYCSITFQANRLHLTSLRNRIDQTEGGDMKKVVKPDQTPQSYFTQYNRIHNKLGYLLGPGVPRGYPIRESYNILTGKKQGYHSI